jgi:hypothetical protein
MAKRVMMAQPMPQSWAAKDWPSEVFPGSARRARKLIKTHRADLMAAGALGRVTRDLIIFGQGYAAWLAAHTAGVSTYVCPANVHRQRAAAAPAAPASRAA